MLVFLINLIIVLIIGGLLWYLFDLAIALLPIPAPAKQVIHLLVVIAFVVWVIGLLTGQFHPLYVGSRL